MKKNDLKNLRTKKTKELRDTISKKKLEIAKILAKISAGQEKNLKKAKNLKKELAQTMTVIKEMEIVESLKETTSK
ncbi:50S ribosomal protein L29 [Candidatus Woesebacteria bacterium]|nr:50S ribosomal protein L29 [Candidatus Woesebacteria bacterium]